MLKSWVWYPSRIFSSANRNCTVVCLSYHIKENGSLQSHSPQHYFRSWRRHGCNPHLTTRTFTSFSRYSTESYPISRNPSSPWKKLQLPQPGRLVLETTKMNPRSTWYILMQAYWLWVSSCASFNTADLSGHGKTTPRRSETLMLTIIPASIFLKIWKSMPV